MFIFSRLKLYLFCIQESKKNNCTTPQGRQKESIATPTIPICFPDVQVLWLEKCWLLKQFLYDLEVYSCLFHWLLIGQMNNRYPGSHCRTPFWQPSNQNSLNPLCIDCIAMTAPPFDWTAPSPWFSTWKWFCLISLFFLETFKKPNKCTMSFRSK